MRFIAKSLLLAALFLFSSTCVEAQFSENREINRWLRKKPDIKLIEINFTKDSTFFKADKIRAILFSKTDNFLRSVKSDRRRKVQRETIRRDTAEVKYLYLSNGFLGVQVMETFEPMLPDSSALIRISIHEGRRFVYDSIYIEGDYEEQFEGNFEKIIKDFKKGEPVDPFELKQATYDIKSVLANNGYPYAKAEYFVDTLYDYTKNNADVTFKISADSLVHFGDVHIGGASKFDSSLARRELTIRPGRIYRRKDVIESQKRLLETGYYLTLYLSQASGDTLRKFNRLRPDFALSLREKKPYYVSIKTGAAQDSLKDLTWTLSGSWGKRNLFKSRLLELTASSSFIVFTEWRLKDHSYRFRITEPWFLGIRMPMTLTAQYSPGVRTAIEDQDYRKESWSVSVSTIRKIKDKIKIQTGLQYESVNIYGLSEEDQERLKQEEGISIRRKVFVDIVRDSRDHPFTPSRGSLTSLGYEYIGGFLGGDDSFIHIEASWSRYQIVWPGWISASRLKAGYVRERGESETVPVDDRLYIGGANTVRSFSEGTLGPRLTNGDGSTPEGANIIIIANQEFRYHLIGKFWSSLFVDVGNGFRNKNEIKWTHLAIAYGTGIQFLSPAGPIRIDYARRVKTETFDAADKIHLTILYAF